MEEKSTDSFHLQEMEVIAEKEDLLQAAITYAYTKHAGDEVMYPPDASKAKRCTICKRAQSLIKQNGKLFYTSILCKPLYTYMLHRVTVGGR